MAGFIRQYFSAGFVGSGIILASRRAFSVDCLPLDGWQMMLFHSMILRVRYTVKKYAALALAAAFAAMASGCASVAVSNDAIEQNTARTLGLSKGSFSISDRVDDGLKASYTVRTGAGKRYACYVVGTVSVVGRVVSDPICSEGGKPAAGGSCNALLKAAGMC